VALYSATKSFVDAFTSSLFRELKGSDVHISVVRPGAVRSAFFDKVALASSGRRIAAERLAVSPERVAERVWSVVRRPRRSAYVPATLVLVPCIELALGWLIDRLGSLALRGRWAPAWPHRLRQVLAGSSAIEGAISPLDRRNHRVVPQNALMAEPPSHRPRPTSVS
jgi:hypothetical protein